MESFRVAMLQMASVGVDQAANLKKAESFCRRAKVLRADVAVFPEMWNVGYTLQRDDTEGPEAWERRAITLDDPFVTRFRELASELDMTLAVTFLERTTEGPPQLGRADRSPGMSSSPTRRSTPATSTRRPVSFRVMGFGWGPSILRKAPSRSG